MMVTTRDGSGLALWRRLRAVAVAGLAVLLVGACDGDTECPSDPPFGGQQPSSCSDDEDPATEATLAATSVPLTAAPGQQITVSYSLVDGSGAAMTGRPVELLGNGSALAVANTDASGNASFLVTMPGVAGPFTLIARAAGESVQNTVQVQ